MNYLYIIIGFIFLIAIGLWIAIRLYKKKKRNKIFRESPPEEIIKELNEIEDEFERRRNEDEETSPYKILWERAFRNKGKSVGRTEQNVNSRELLQQHGEQQGFQDRVLEDINSDEGSDGRPIRKIKRRFIRRGRR